MASTAPTRMSRLVSGGVPAPVLLLLLVVLFLGALSGPAMADHMLYPTESLLKGQSLNQGNYTLTMQTDCNLVLYDSGRPIWASDSGNRGAECRVTMLNDGNLVVYTGRGTPVWSSGTGRPGIGNYVLVLQRDRNLVIYGPSIWATGTNPGGVGGLKKQPQLVGRPAMRAASNN